MTRYTLADLRKAAPVRSRVVPRRPDPALEAWYRQLHAQILGERRPASGRAGRYVYYWAYGRLCWRAYVVPKDPRTAVQRRSRAAFGAASKAWSESRLLTQERRAAWRAAAAKIKSAPRLGQSGPLTAQQTFVGQNSLKEQWNLPLLLEPPKRGSKKAEPRARTAGSATQARQPQAVAPPTLGARQECAALAPPSPPRATPIPARQRSRPPSAVLRRTDITHHASFRPSQVQFPQRLTRPSSEPFRTTTAPLPVQCRWPAQSGAHLGRFGSHRWSSTRAAGYRELWRGG